MLEVLQSIIQDPSLVGSSQTTKVWLLFVLWIMPIWNCTHPLLYLTLKSWALHRILLFRFLVPEVAPANEFCVSTITQPGVEMSVSYFKSKSIIQASFRVWERSHTHAITVIPTYELKGYGNAQTHYEADRTSVKKKFFQIFLLFPYKDWNRLKIRILRVFLATSLQVIALEFEVLVDVGRGDLSTLILGLVFQQIYMHERKSPLLSGTSVYMGILTWKFWNVTCCGIKGDIMSSLFLMGFCKIEKCNFLICAEIHHCKLCRT